MECCELDQTDAGAHGASADPGVLNLCGPSPGRGRCLGRRHRRTTGSHGDRHARSPALQASRAPTPHGGPHAPAGSLRREFLRFRIFLDPHRGLSCALPGEEAITVARHRGGSRWVQANSSARREGRERTATDPLEEVSKSRLLLEAEFGAPPRPAASSARCSSRAMCSSSERRGDPLRHDGAGGRTRTLRAASARSNARLRRAGPWPRRPT